MRGDDFLEDIEGEAPSRVTRSANTDRALAEHLGSTVAGLGANWRSKENITVRQMVGLIERVEKSRSAR